MVGFSENRKMGEQAQMASSSNYRNSVGGAMKRLCGLAFDSDEAKMEMGHCVGLTFVPISHASGGPDSVGVQVELAGETKIIPVEQVAGMMIHHMGTIAAQKAAETSNETDASKLFPQDWVVSIPAYFTDAQRRALLDGCAMVGLTSQVQRLMHEPTATALSYGIFKDLRKEFTADKPTHIMFIDFGASAFTVSIANFEPGKLQVLSAVSDKQLGGRDIDELIAQWLADEFKAKYGKKLSGEPMERPKTRLKLLTAAEKAKKTLSPYGVKEARINLEMIMDDLDFSITLKADKYEAMLAPLLERMSGPVQQALAEAKLQAADMASVEIVGGSTRITAVKNKLTELLGGQNLSTTMNADEAVARGTALQSAILSPRFKVLPYDIQECQPFPVTVAWDTPVTEENSVVMFDRGLNFPIVRRVTIKKKADFTVEAYYEPTKPIATFHVPLQANGDEDVKIRVNIKEDPNGVLQMSSVQKVEEKEPEPPKEGEEEKEAEGEKKAKITKTNLEYTVKRPLQWTQKEIDEAHEKEVAMANNDRIVRETADMRNELESYIYEMRDKISSDSDLGPYGTDEEKDAFVALNEKMENWLYEDGFEATKTVYAEKLKELKALGAPMQQRQSEAMGRAAAVSTLQQTLEVYKNWVVESQTNESYSHITDEERNKVHTACDETSAWMYQKLDEQGSLSPNQDPVLTVAELNAKVRFLKETCGPIMHKPVPKKTEIPKPTEEPNKEEEGPKDGDPMEGVEVNGGEEAKAEDAASEEATKNAMDVE
jgi:heat shock protein 4